VPQIEEAFVTFTKRRDIAIVLITQVVSVQADLSIFMNG
jgi:hypothetical protein